VAVGSDFDGGVSPLVIPDVSQFVQITRALMARGFSEEEIQKIWSGNFLRILKQVVDI
jgi:membrane dipeptidase